MLASVLEPEQHHKLKKLVEDQKHQSFSRPNKAVASAAPTPNKPSAEDREDAQVDDDGAMSDRTQATAQLWTSSVPISHDQADVSVPFDESTLQNLSMDDIMSIQILLHREMERRTRAAAAGVSSPLHPVSSSSTPIPPPPHVTPSANHGQVDQQAVDSRKGLKRSKSGGNESAFNPRSRTPQPKTSAVSLGHNAKLDLHAVEKEDPELLSVHSDVLNTTNGSASNPVNITTVPIAPPATTTGIAATGRPVSRTNGALHPHDKMLYGHGNTALPCLSPMGHPAQSSPLMDMNVNSRSSSRPPSRGVTLANFEDRLSSSLGGGGSQSLGGNNFTAESLEAIIPIEAVNISNAHMTLDQYLTSNRPQPIQREISRSELVLSPFSAFDDISLGSQSVNSSISSRQQRRPRRRDTQTSTSTINTINSGASSSVQRHHNHHPSHR